MLSSSYYNKIQINYSLDRDSGGNVIKSSLLINIREKDVATAVELYEELQRQLVGENEEFAPKHGNTDQDDEKESSPVPECPKHNIKMLLRSRKSDGQLFFGCHHFQSGCKETAQYPIPEEALGR